MSYFGGCYEGWGGDFSVTESMGPNGRYLDICTIRRKIPYLLQVVDGGAMNCLHDLYKSQLGNMGIYVIHQRTQNYGFPFSQLLIYFPIFPLGIGPLCFPRLGRHTVLI